MSFGKISTIAGLLFIVMSQGSCRKWQKITEFTLSFSETVVIPASTAINLPFNVMSPPVATNFESEIAANDSRKDLIRTVVISAVTLQLTQPPGSDFNFLKSLRIFLKSEGLPEKEIAWKDPVPSGSGNTLSLDVSDEDLSDYIKREQLSLRVMTVSNRLLAADHSIEVTTQVKVRAGLIPR